MYVAESGLGTPGVGLETPAVLDLCCSVRTMFLGKGIKYMAGRRRA